jgi:hypothetical protein
MRAAVAGELRSALNERTKVAGDQRHFAAISGPWASRREVASRDLRKVEGDLRKVVNHQAKVVRDRRKVVNGQAKIMNDPATIVNDPARIMNDQATIVSH